MKSASSRLIEIEDETYVLADKTNDVNQQVQELLGLTIDDFTRAVVLPQGKFAEFLSLKGRSAVKCFSVFLISSSTEISLVRKYAIKFSS